MTKSTSVTVTDDDLYRHTSQFRLWSFTREALEAKRSGTYQRALAKVRNDLDQQGFSNIPCITFEEERRLVRFYAGKINDIAKVFRMPSQVKGTAISYFLKFYLTYSVMDKHPKNIMYTCVFLASKAENYFIPIDTFCSSLPRVERADILDLEFLLVQSMSFTLAVQSALQPLHGFFLDMQTIFENDEQRTKFGSVYDQARGMIIDGFISDAQFLYTPPQIALAALHSVDPETVEKYLSLKFGDSHKDIAEVLRETLGSCQKDLSDTSLPTSEEGKSIDRKLHNSLNPKWKLKRSAAASVSSTPSSGEETKKPKLED